MALLGLVSALLHLPGTGLAQEVAAPPAGDQLWPVSVASVLAAAQAFRPGVEWSQAAITLPPGLRVRAEHAALRATEARGGREAGHIVLRIECRFLRDCAPFWADVRVPASVGAPLRENATQTPALTTRSDPDRVRAPMVRPGRPVALICSQAGLQISMQVVPLERASLGETVKVLDPQTRRRFLAQVEGPDRVRSDLREAK